MIQTVKKDDKTVTIETTEGIFKRTFLDDIQEVLVHSDRVLVRLNYMDKSKTLGNRNIFCLNERGDVLWQIQDPDTYPPGFPKSDSPFVGVRITKDNKLRATSWDSHGYEVDINTGMLSNAEFTK